jgi:hypothetical protein
MSNLSWDWDYSFAGWGLGMETLQGWTEGWQRRYPGVDYLGYDFLG